MKKLTREQMAKKKAISNAKWAKRVKKAQQLIDLGCDEKLAVQITENRLGIPVEDIVDQCRVNGHSALQALRILDRHSQFQR